MRFVGIKILRIENLEISKKQLNLKRTRYKDNEL